MSSTPESNIKSDADIAKTALTETSVDGDSSANGADDFEISDGYLQGWRFWLTMISLYASQFLVTLEMSIVATALVAITSDLKDFQHSTWVSNAYFITWSGFLILWTQFSHSMGRKISYLSALGLFVIFSAACASAQTAVQLYIFRGFQGLAGGGVFILPLIVSVEAVPPSQMPKYTGIQAINALVAFTTGPIIGGAIAARTTWRWIFILNVPPGCIAFLMVLLALPNSFPHHNKPKADRPALHLASLKQLDLVGGLLFLGMSVLSVTALQEADTSYSWSSATIICLLVFAGLSTIAFVFWEKFITQPESKIMPVLTYRFVRRQTIAMLATSFLIGVPFMSTMVQIPQRLQVIDGLSPLQAAVHLLPYLTLVPVGAGLSTAICKGRLQTKPLFGQLAGALFQLIAAVCFAVDSQPPYPQSYLSARQYGFQVLMGLGSGFAYLTNLNGMYYTIGRHKDLIAPSIGANQQFRFLGAALGLGAVTAAFNTYCRTHLSAFLSPDQILLLLESGRSVTTLSSELRVQVVQTFGAAFTLQWQIICGFVGLQIIAILFTY